MGTAPVVDGRLGCCRPRSSKQFRAVVAVPVLSPARRRLLALLLTMLAGGCAGSGSSGAAPLRAVATGESLTTQTDPAFSLSYPRTWTYREGSSPYGIYNNFIGPKGHGGFEQAVLVGRTTYADRQTYADAMTAYGLAHPERTLEPAAPLAVPGAVEASIVRNTRTLKGTPIRSWTVFVLTPSKVVLNLEFVAPAEDFDEPRMSRLLSTLHAT
jgi:hypothetical protein